MHTELPKPWMQRFWNLKPTAYVWYNIRTYVRTYIENECIWSFCKVRTYMGADTNVVWQMKYYYRLRNRLQMPRWFIPTACLCTYPPPQPPSQTKLAHWNRRLGDGLKHTSYGSFSVLKCLNAFIMPLWHSRIEFPRVVLGSWWSSFPDHRFVPRPCPGIACVYIIYYLE